MRNLLFAMALLMASPVLGQWDRWTFEGFPVYSKIPEDAVGLVILLHGSGGSAEFAARTDTTNILNTLLGAGYGFFATSSTQRTDPRALGSTQSRYHDESGSGQAGTLVQEDNP